MKGPAMAKSPKTAAPRKPSKRLPKLELDDFRMGVSHSKFIITSPNEGRILDGPFDLTKAVNRVIEIRRNGEACRLFATREVFVPERWLDNEQEAIANDLR